MISSDSFIIDKSEIDRRKNSFTHLLLSLFLGLVFSSYFAFSQFIIQNFVYFATVSLIFLLVFVIFKIIIFRFFVSYLLTEIHVTDKVLERKTQKSHDTVLLAGIEIISIKRTSRGTIREVGIWTKNGKTLFLDAIEHFEELKNCLVHSKKGVKIEESLEPFDYDHPMFYPVLGVLLSILTIVSITLLTSLSLLQIKLAYFAFTIYLFLLGGYFLINKPLTKRYGEKQRLSDIVIGIITVLISITFMALFIGS